MLLMKKILFPRTKLYLMDELVFLQPVEYNSYFAGACISWRWDANGGAWQPHYRITDHLGSTRLETSSNGTITAAYDYKPFGEQIPLMTSKTRKTYIGKERDDESYLGDFGVRKYDYAAGRFTSPDVMFEKYMTWSPYQYSMNNPINLLDFNGKNGVKVVDDEVKTITIQAVYVYNEKLGGNLQDIQQANKDLNDKNYTVTEGIYDGYSVKFDLSGVPSGSNHEDDQNTSGGINIGNTYQANADFKWLDKKTGKENFNEKNGIIHGGTTLDNNHIAMNQPYNTTRNLIHEIFHTLFFNNDGAETGIGNYKPGTEMPTPNDINQLIYNPALKEVK